MHAARRGGDHYIIPAGEYDRRDDPATGRKVAVAWSYHRVAQTPVGPFAAMTAIPGGWRRPAR